MMMMSMMRLTSRMKLQGVTVILLTASMVASESFLIPELDNKTNDVMKRKSQNSDRQYQRELNEVAYLHRVSENSDAELLRELIKVPSGRTAAVDVSSALLCVLPDSLAAAFVNKHGCC